MLWPGWSPRRPAMAPGRSSTGCTNMWSRPRSRKRPEGIPPIISGNVVEEIAKLKQQPGKDIIIDGSATLVHSLMGTDLIDEYRFWSSPSSWAGEGGFSRTGRRRRSCGSSKAQLSVLAPLLLSTGQTSNNRMVVRKQAAAAERQPARLPRVAAHELRVYGRGRSDCGGAGRDAGWMYGGAVWWVTKRWRSHPSRRRRSRQDAARSDHRMAA